MYSVFFFFFFTRTNVSWTTNYKSLTAACCSALWRFLDWHEQISKRGRGVSINLGQKQQPTEAFAHWHVYLLRKTNKRCLNKKQYQQQYQGLESVLFSQCCMEEVENEAPTPTWLWSKSMTPIQYTLAPNSLAFIAWESQKENLSHDSTDIQWIHVTYKTSE